MTVLVKCLQSSFLFGFCLFFSYIDLEASSRCYCFLLGLASAWLDRVWVVVEPLLPWLCSPSRLKPCPRDLVALPASQAHGGFLTTVSSFPLDYLEVVIFPVRNKASGDLAQVSTPPTVLG